MLPNEQEVLDGRLPFAEAQRLLDGSSDGVMRYRSIGWYGSDFHPDRGFYAIIHQDDPELVGDRLRLSYKGRSVCVYAFGSADVGEHEIVITRRAFAELELLSKETISCRVEVLVG